MKNIKSVAAALVVVLGFAVSTALPARATLMEFAIFGADFGGGTLTGGFDVDVTFSGTDKALNSFSVSDSGTGNSWNDGDIVTTALFFDAVDPTLRNLKLIVQNTDMNNQPANFLVLLPFFPVAPAFGTYGVLDANQSTVAVGVGSILQVPEPGTLALFGLGLAGLGVARRRKAA